MTVKGKCYDLRFCLQALMGCKNTTDACRILIQQHCPVPKELCKASK